MQEEKLFNEATGSDEKETREPYDTEPLRVLVFSSSTIMSQLVSLHLSRTAKVERKWSRVPGKLTGQDLCWLCRAARYQQVMRLQRLQRSAKPSAIIEYWFPWYFISTNPKLNLKYLPNTRPQFQSTTSRRILDPSQSIAFAMQGNIEGLKYLFGQGLALPGDVSDSRGYTLLRVCHYLLYIVHTYRADAFAVGTLWRHASVRNRPFLA